MSFGGFPGSSAGKESTCKAGGLGSIPGWEDPMEKGTATHSSILVWRIQDWCWSWSSNTLATWCEELTHWKRPWCWERLKARGERDNRGWDNWMASPTQWTWVWASSRSSISDGQGSLASCSPWGHKQLDMTERLIWSEGVLDINKLHVARD